MPSVTVISMTSPRRRVIRNERNLTTCASTDPWPTVPQRSEVGELAALVVPARVVPQQVADGRDLEREVTDGVENLRNAGLANGKPAVLIILYRQPGANIISTVDA